MKFFSTEILSILSLLLLALSGSDAALRGGARADEERNLGREGNNAPAGNNGEDQGNPVIGRVSVAGLATSWCEDLGYSSDICGGQFSLNARLYEDGTAKGQVADRKYGNAYHAEIDCIRFIEQDGETRAVMSGQWTSANAAGYKFLAATMIDENADAFFSVGLFSFFIDDCNYPDLYRLLSTNFFAEKFQGNVVINAPQQ